MPRQAGTDGHQACGKVITVDRNEKQNSFRNTRNTRGTNREIRGLKTRFYIMTAIAAVLLVALIIMIVLLVGKTDTDPTRGTGQNGDSTQTKDTEIDTKKDTEEVSETVAALESVEGAATEKETDEAALKSEAEKESDSTAQLTEAGAEPETAFEPESETTAGGENVTEADTASTAEDKTETETGAETEKASEPATEPIPEQETVPVHVYVNGKGTVKVTGEGENAPELEVEANNHREGEFAVNSVLTIEVIPNADYNVESIDVASLSLEKLVNDNSDQRISKFAIKLDSEKLQEEDVTVKVTFSEKGTVQTETSSNGTGEGSDQQNAKEESLKNLKSEIAFIISTSGSESSEFLFEKVSDQEVEELVNMDANNAFNLVRPADMFLIGAVYSGLKDSVQDPENPEKTIYDDDVQLANLMLALLGRELESPSSENVTVEGARQELLARLGGYQHEGDEQPDNYRVTGTDKVSSYAQNYGASVEGFDNDTAVSISISSLVRYFGDLHSVAMWPLEKQRENQLAKYKADAKDLSGKSALIAAMRKTLKENAGGELYWFDDTAAQEVEGTTVHSCSTVMFERDGAWYVFGLYLQGGTLDETRAQKLAELLWANAGGSGTAWNGGEEEGVTDKETEESMHEDEKPTESTEEIGQSPVTGVDTISNADAGGVGASYNEQKPNEDEKNPKYNEENATELEEKG